MWLSGSGERETFYAKLFFMTKDNDSDDAINWKLPALIVGAVLLLWILSGLILFRLENRGSFGDMFGTVNALFSGLAFAGVIYAILLQKKELSLQRKELELTRNELKGQKDEMALQNQTMKTQSFESTFFQLLRLHGDIVGAIDLIDTNGRTTSGRDCIKIFYNRFHERTWAKDHAHLRGQNEEERINKSYLAFYESYQSEFGHYFRSLYHIVKLVDQSSVENKRLYTNLIRAQLSSYELTLLFYNCLSDMGREKFKPFIEKYALLKNLSAGLLINPPDHKGLYNPSAYGE